MAQPGYTHQHYPCWIHDPKGEHPSKLIHGEDEEDALLTEWGVDKRDADDALDQFRRDLLARAEKAHLKVNERWTDGKLKQEVERAEAKKA